MLCYMSFFRCFKGLGDLICIRVRCGTGGSGYVRVVEKNPYNKHYVNRKNVKEEVDKVHPDVNFTGVLNGFRFLAISMLEGDLIHWMKS